jgi:hypothetical protein
MLKLWRGLLWFYAIGSAITGLAALLFGYGLVFPSAILAFSASAFWAVRSQSPLATLVCGVAGVLPMLAGMTLLGPDADRLTLMAPALVGGGLWLILCTVAARQLGREARPAA